MLSILITKQINKDQQVEKLEKENTEIPFWQMPHNRFEYPHFSKQLVAIDPGSYHRLGLALTDSYLRADTEIDGKIPNLENKSVLDEDDIELLNLASSLENISKKICKSANRLAYKKNDNDSMKEKELISLDFSENVILTLLVCLYTGRPYFYPQILINTFA